MLHLSANDNHSEPADAHDSGEESDVEEVLEGAAGGDPALAKAQRSKEKLKQKLKQAKDACAANRDAALAWKEKQQAVALELESLGCTHDAMREALGEAVGDLRRAEAHALALERALAKEKSEGIALERRYKTLQTDFNGLRRRSAQAVHLAEPSRESLREVTSQLSGIRDDRKRYEATVRFAARQHEALQKALTAVDDAQADRATGALDVRQQKLDKAAAEKKAAEAKAQNRELKNKVATLAGQLYRALGQLREHGIQSTTAATGEARVAAAEVKRASAAAAAAAAKAATSASAQRATVPEQPRPAIPSPPLPPQDYSPDDGGSDTPPSPPSSVASCNSSVILVPTPAHTPAGQQQRRRSASCSDGEVTDVESDAETPAVLPTGTSMNLSGAMQAAGQQQPMAGLPTVAKARFRRKDALGSALNKAVFSPALDFDSELPEGGDGGGHLQPAQVRPSTVSSSVNGAAPTAWLAANASESDDWLQAALREVPVLTATAGSDASAQPPIPPPTARSVTTTPSSASVSSSAQSNSGPSSSATRKRSRGPVFSTAGGADAPSATHSSAPTGCRIRKPRDGPSNPFKARRFGARHTSAYTAAKQGAADIKPRQGSAAPTHSATRVPRASASMPGKPAAAKPKKQSRLLSGVGSSDPPPAGGPSAKQGSSSAAGRPWQRGVGPSSDGYFYSSANGETDHVSMDLSIYEQLRGNGRLGWG